MIPFTYARPGTTAEVVRELAAEPLGQIIAGGTNLLDLMKEGIARPVRLLDVQALPLAELEEHADGTVRLGARLTNAATAYHPVIERRYPLLAKAILAGASPQLRNAATDGGNLLQRTRCYYFYDLAFPCNKRAPGTGCPAIGGFNRIHAILGTSEHCIATHPSDFCVALAALEAVVHVEGPDGARTIPFAEFHRLPGDTPHLDTNLAPAELITAIELPAAGYSEHHAYVKLRDRESYAFALVSVAAALELGDDGRIESARLALGGVAHKPWRDPAVEALLVGQMPGPEAFGAAARHLLLEARGYGHNDFKIELARRAIVRALGIAAGQEEPV